MPAPGLVLAQSVGKHVAANGWHRKRTDTPAERSRAKQYASSEHRTTRAAIQRAIDAGEPYVCSRRLPGCIGRIPPFRPRAWHLDHDDNDRSRYRGVTCAQCNVKAAASKGARLVNARRRQARNRRPRARDW